MYTSFELRDGYGNPILLRETFDADGRLAQIDDYGALGAAYTAKKIAEAGSTVLDVLPLTEDLVGTVMPVFNACDIDDVAIVIDFVNTPTQYTLRAIRPTAGAGGDMPDEVFRYNYITAMARCWYRFGIPSQFVFTGNTIYVKATLAVAGTVDLAVTDDGVVRMLYDTSGACAVPAFPSGVLFTLSSVGASMTDADGVAAAIAGAVNAGPGDAYAEATGATVDLYYPQLSAASLDGFNPLCVGAPDGSQFTLDVTPPTDSVGFGVTVTGVETGVSLP